MNLKLLKVAREEQRQLPEGLCSVDEMKKIQEKTPIGEQAAFWLDAKALMSTFLFPAEKTARFIPLTESAEKCQEIQVEWKSEEEPETMYLWVLEEGGFLADIVDTEEIRGYQLETNIECVLYRIYGA